MLERGIFFSLHIIMKQCLLKSHRDLNEPAILVFSKTNSFRHKDGIKAGNAFFQTLAEEQELGIFQTENSAVFNLEDLAGFSVVIFNNVTGDVLSESQEEAFRQWLESGGGWLGLHGAGDDSHSDWAWYVDTLIGAKFIAHIMGPQFQIATVSGRRYKPCSHAETATIMGA